MSDQFNEDMVRAVVAVTVRQAQVIALREAVAALEDVDPDDIREWLLARAEGIESSGGAS